MEIFHYLVPDGDKIIHWYSTPSDFRAIVHHKRRCEPERRCLSEQADVSVRVLNPRTGCAADYWMSELMMDGTIPSI